MGIFLFLQFENVPWDAVDFFRDCLLQMVEGFWLILINYFFEIFSEEKNHKRDRSGDRESQGRSPRLEIRRLGNY